MRFLTSSSWIAAHSQTLRLLALSLSYAASLLIFQQGLLVKRQVLPQRSACCSSDSVVAFNTKHKHCWLPPRFNKTVLLIVDALRYDFIFPYDNYKGRLHPLPNSRYHRQMTKVAQLMREQPANSALFPFIADAPTTTFQRIKALVTGSVPAFIEAGENFGGTEISEDNIVDQLVAKGGNATLLGDETWIQLLPGRFHRHFEEPSFDIKDLDRVDDTVIAHIYHELARPDWTLLVAHCLGVDHAGHRYGPDHPEMSRKLRQMDSLIWELTRRLSEDTILLVLGDHGMTASGDHGGDSHQELVSALFAYTRQPGGFEKARENNGTSSAAAEKGNDGGGGTREGGEKPVKAVKQVDLVPTLAFLLDLPIPFSNIGQFIFPLFSGNLLQEIRLNTVQMLRYAQEYAKHKPELREQLRQIVREHESSLNDFEANRQTIQALQSLIRRSLDSQFQWTVCFLGLLSLLDALMFNCYLLAAGPDECLSICLWVFRSALLLLQLSLIFAQQPSTDQVLFSVASLLLSLSYQVPACLTKLVRSSQSAANIHNNLLSLLVIGGGQLVLAILPFSNSFIIYEADVLRFAIQSLVLIVTARLIHLYRITSIWQMPQQLSDMLMRSVFILVFLRVMRPFESCREEQVECIDYKSAESQLFLHCLLVSFGCAYLQLEYFWPATGDGHQDNDNGVHLTTRAFVWPMTALLCLHWLFELSAQSMQAGRLVEDEKRSAAIASTVATLELCSRVLGQLIFGTLILHHLALRWRRNDETGGNSDDNETKEASTTTVCRRRRNGRLQAQFQALSVPLMMLVGPAQAWKLALLLTMFPMAEQLFCIEKVWTRAWLLHLLGAYAFFGTGNQQTLSSIPWRAAFVALPGNFPYKWLPALLVLSSMFAGGVVASLMVLRDETGGMAPLYFMLFGGLKVFGCSAASLLHHRHLMFYKVFAPKFVFESVEFLFTCAFIVVWVCLFRRTGRHTVLDK